MTRPKFFNQLLKATSENRLNSYHSSQDNTEMECYARYLWNIALSESLYPTLHGLEVTLRNSIHNAISNKLGEENWFDGILVDKGKEALEEIREGLEQKRKPKDDVNQLIASSSFGFWVSLFNKDYENVLWHRNNLLKDIFPYMPNRSRTRKILSRRLNRIRDLRNRVFHYEPIWHWKNLDQHHNNMIEAIGWMNPSVRHIVGVQDRFPEIYQSGTSGYEKILLYLIS